MMSRFVLAIWPLATLLLEGVTWLCFPPPPTACRSIYLLRLTAEVVTDDVGHVVDGTTGEANVNSVSDYTR